MITIFFTFSSHGRWSNFGHFPMDEMIVTLTSNKNSFPEGGKRKKRKKKLSKNSHVQLDVLKNNS
jgi:hypothetical protein